MILVQILLILAAVSIAVIGLRSRASYGVNAWKKLLFSALMLVVVIAVVSPALVSRAAQLVGVGRGTDLVLYTVSVAFGFYVVNQYLRSQDAREELHRLARRIAVVEAADKYGLSAIDPRSQARSSAPAEPSHDVSDSD